MLAAQHTVELWVVYPVMMQLFGNYRSLLLPRITGNVILHVAILGKDQNSKISNVFTESVSFAHTFEFEKSPAKPLQVEPLEIKPRC